jgi:hypothetical protein
MMNHLVRHTIECLCFVALSAGPAALADSTFVIEDPPVDFEVIDAEPFDGIGDNGPYYTFNDAALGTEGEARSMAEFDVSAFTIPPGEFIFRATLEVRITSVGVYGLGINGEHPDRLAVDGYVANGIDELSDFQAGDGNVLDLLDTSDPELWQVLTFDVTGHVADLVAAQETYVGLTVRADTFGGFWVGEGSGYPKLTIETDTPGDLNHDGRVDLSDLGTLLAHYGMVGVSYEDGDINHDGQVNLSDLGILLAHYGEGT